MLFDDRYQTIQQPVESIFTDKGSKFIAIAFPIRSEQDFKQRLAEVKLKHPKANHHCWALRLSPDRSVFKLNDDGEPTGTAGRPILNILLSKDITDVGLVVVRYFGGTLLGVPGLINAYKTSAQQVIAAAKVIERVIKDVYTITFDYQEMNNIMRLIKEQHLDIITQTFDNTSVLQVAIEKMKINQVLQKLNSLLGVDTQYNYTL